MRIILRHVQAQPQTGRLSFRRAYPPELLPFIPAGKSGKPPTELKISLATKSAASPHFHDRYSAALARYDAVTGKARKAATGAYDTLDPRMIAYLGQVFEAQWLEYDDKARWSGGPDWAERSRHGWDYKLDDFKGWSAQGDIGAIVEEWGDAARDLLSSEGLAIDPHADDVFDSLCKELNDSAIRVSKIALARLAGEIIPSPAPPPPIAAAAAAAAHGPEVPLLATFDDYAAAILSPLTAQDWRRCIVQLVAFLGHDDARKLSTADLMLWRDKLSVEPARGGKAPRAAATIRGKYLGSVKAMLNWAVEEHRLETNVALGVTVRGKKRPKLRDRDFTDEEAHRILQATLVPPNNRLAKEYALARRWVPWLCAYTGARVQEMAQLRGVDVRKIEGVWTVRITPEAGTVKAQVARIVPLHPHLIEQGFPGVVESLGDGPLFYDPARQRVQADTNRHVRKVGEKLAAWVRKDVGIVDPNVAPNHGWRHRFKTVAMAAGIQQRIADAIQGHAPASIGQTYGSVTIPTMAEAIALLPRYAIPEV